MSGYWNSVLKIKGFNLHYLRGTVWLAKCSGHSLLHAYSLRPEDSVLARRSPSLLCDIHVVIRESAVKLGYWCSYIFGYPEVWFYSVCTV